MFSVFTVVAFLFNLVFCKNVVRGFVAAMSFAIVSWWKEDELLLFLFRRSTVVQACDRDSSGWKKDEILFRVHLMFVSALIKVVFVHRRRIERSIFIGYQFWKVKLAPQGRTSDLSPPACSGSWFTLGQWLFCLFFLRGDISGDHPPFKFQTYSICCSRSGCRCETFGFGRLAPRHTFGIYAERECSRRR